MRRSGVISVADTATFLQVVLVLCVLILSLCPCANAGDKADKDAMFDCRTKTFNSTEGGNGQSNEVYPGKKLTWWATGEAGTKVTIVFQKQDMDDRKDCEGVSPFDGTIKPGTIHKSYGFTKIKSPKIRKDAQKADKDKCYSYAIECTSADGKKVNVDPIIVVPRP